MSPNLNRRSTFMKTETIDYRDGDVTLKGFLAYDERQSGKRPGILVMPEAFGLGIHAKQRAQRLVELGYVAFAGDPYGNGVEAKDLQEAMKLAGPLTQDPTKFRQRGRAALDRLASFNQVDSTRLGAIGFCMGGTFGLELARDGAPLRGVATFHAGLQTQRPAVEGQVKASILVLTGADDPFVPADQVIKFQQEMTKAKVDWQVITYSNTVHSFTNPDAASVGNPGLAYNKLTDERSWKAMALFFEEVFRA
jgi:dienelactone hydrolase